MIEKSISTTHWKKYLVPSENKRVERFLESRGNQVFWQLAQNIHKASSNSKTLKKNLVMVVHENAPYAILIEEKDYQEVLELALQWFVKQEEYEICSKIVKFKDDIRKFKTKQREQKLIKNLI